MGFGVREPSTAAGYYLATARERVRGTAKGTCFEIAAKRSSAGAHKESGDRGSIDRGAIAVPLVGSDTHGWLGGMHTGVAPPKASLRSMRTSQSDVVFDVDSPFEAASALSGIERYCQGYAPPIR